jgi:hypothetical protein
MSLVPSLVQAAVPEYPSVACTGSYAGLLSAPVLDCGSTLPLNDAGPPSDAASEALIACGVRHAATGVDLSAYDAVEVARDLQDLRSALHLDQFGVFGVSFGTRVAFSVVRTQVAGLRAVARRTIWAASWWTRRMTGVAPDRFHATCRPSRAVIQ